MSPNLIELDKGGRFLGATDCQSRGPPAFPNGRPVAFADVINSSASRRQIGIQAALVTPARIIITPDNVYSYSPLILEEYRMQVLAIIGQSAPFLLVPRSPRHRTGCIYPLLACDNLDYVLGTGDKNMAFVQLIEEAEADAGDAALETCLRFYENKSGIHDARKCFRRTPPAAGSVIALSLGGPVILREKVRSFWREHYARNFRASEYRSRRHVRGLRSDRPPRRL